MKTKYKKVQVSERLPDANTDVIILGDMEDVSKGYVSDHNNWWQYGRDTVDNIEYWLQEVPDYEEEIREMLGRIVGFTSLGEKVPDHLTHEIEELLTKLKTES